MECSVVRNLLLDNKYISAIEVQQNKTYKNKNYEILVYCQLEIYGKWIPIVIGIPKDWQINLFDIYWESNFSFIPHLDKRGKFCLYDLEGAVIDPNLSGLLNQCILRTRELVKDGEYGNNREDFLLEFDSYFALLPNVKHAEVDIPASKYSGIIKFHKKKINSKRKNESYVEYKKRQKNTSYFVSSEPDNFKTWKIDGTQQNGLFLYIEPTHPVYPPNYLNFDENKFINQLFEFVDIKTFDKLKSKCGHELLVVFEIKQGKTNTNCCGFIIESPIFKITDKVEVEAFSMLIPLLINRIDTQYLTNRTSFVSNKLANKSYLMIGCGSIGGYVFHNLIKSACKNITIIDDDIMKAENIYRHFLGMESKGMYKSVALANYAKSTIPELNITSIVEKIEYAIEDCGIDFNDYDYIISTTGSHTVNLWLNKFLIDNKINTTAFYIWNEALDIGCHVALVNTERKCDYRSLFDRDENGELFDLTSFCMRNQNFAKSYSGCSGTFIPYGSTLSLNSSLLFIDLLKQEVDGRIKNNMLVSEKGDDYYFKRAGFETSDRYNKQIEKYSMIKLEDFRKDIV
ncbi:ThiF family adenylyltransferase [Eubacterium callanderi]|uniref:ThiF family adenylyltransferase n=1 Tax=Eubacterium callanderi TaxID=53442 RepID=UPI001C11AF54|nr:ThiF family adenylyltransferase [Eubacterium callanderi]MBU5304830.1 ThiF family adenylyltransferase [Eubacterium callanderi]WPK69003.1 hypothetical protein EUCA2A_31780 [Eubacterium callanderi]WPK73301.1 hypothetical protein EUCA11A_31780 [Eubacterium callanderi]